MVNRLDLQRAFVDALGSKNVYFQPPESVKLQYPCIIYEEARGDTIQANDRNYIYRKAYSVLVIDKDPDSTIPDRIREFPLCASGSPYKVDNLNHWPFTIYI